MGINREILSLAIPSILANITVPIVGMVDIAVAGHLDTGTSGLSVATLIGAVAIGSMLFDILYWNFGFLRVGTGGLVAQAFGKGDSREIADIFCRAIGISLLCSVLLIAIQWVFVRCAFMVVDCTPQVRELASQYFFIRIWAAPATLSLMAFKGWFIGMQDGISPMVTDLLVNGMNVLMSIVLALGFNIGGFRYEGIGFAGIAAGTVIAQYSGMLCAILIVLLRYRKRIFSAYRPGDVPAAFRGGQMRRFFTMNTDLFVRSLCFIAIYIGFTTLSAHYGDLLLATSSIMMKLLLVFSYFTDGFAYAGEALAGKYIGRNDRPALVRTVRDVFMWSMGIGIVFTLVYAVAGEPMLRVMTSDPEVVDASMQFMSWLLLMPVIGCAAFTWDGIYIGATAARTIRNAMIWATAAFFTTYFSGLALLDILGTDSRSYGTVAIHILLGAYFAHLVVRTVHLSLRYKKVILAEPFRNRI